MSQVEDLLTDDYGNSLPSQERMYLLSLTRFLSQALGDIAAFGVVDIRNSIDQLIGALTKLAQADPDPGRAAKVRAFVGEMAEKASGVFVGATVTYFSPYVLGAAEQAVRALTTR